MICADNMECYPINYDPRYCEQAPYIFYFMRFDGYMLGGEYKTLEEASVIRDMLMKEHGKDANWMTIEERDELYADDLGEHGI